MLSWPVAELLLTAVPLICWVFFRCYQLLSTPAQKLARLLNVDIPHVPVVCVDSIGTEHAVVHWDIELSNEENIIYVLLVNGRDSGSLAQTSVRLCSLLPGTMYKVQILAVNALSNFRLQLAPVYFRTRYSDKQEKPQIRQSVAALPPPDDVVSTNYSLDLQAADVGALDDADVLSKYLYLFQNELKRFKADIWASSVHQKEEESRLKSELDELRRELSSGLDLRAKRENDVKDLERRKDELTFDRLKLMRQVKFIETQRHLHETKLAELRAKAAKLRERNHHVTSAAASEELRSREIVAHTTAETEAIKAEIAALEEATRVLSQEKRDLLHVIDKLRPLLKQFTTPQAVAPGEGSPSLLQISIESQGEIFTKESTLTKLGVDTLSKICALRPDWEGDINSEIETLLGLELSWRETFRTGIRKYVGIQNSLEIARSNRNPGYEIQRMNEYTASVEFGGYGNALGKRRPTENVMGLTEDKVAGGSYSFRNAADTSIGYSDQNYSDNTHADLAVYPEPSQGNYMDPIAAPQFADTSVYTNEHLGAYPESAVYSRDPHSAYSTSSLYGNVNPETPVYSNTLPESAVYSTESQAYLEPASYDIPGESYPDVPGIYPETSDLYDGAANGNTKAYMDTSSYHNVASGSSTSLTNTPFIALPLSHSGSALLAVPMLLLPQSLVMTQSSSHLSPRPVPMDTYADPLISPVQSFPSQQRASLPPPVVPPSISAQSMQQYAQSIRQNFPYDDQIYSPASPDVYNPSNNGSSTLWNLQGYADRRNLLGSLAPPFGGLPSPSNSLNLLLLPSHSAQYSIWLDQGQQLRNHQRNVSGGSMWRNDLSATRADNSQALQPEFSPFGETPDSSDVRLV